MSTTPGRRTELVIDPPRIVAVQPPWWEFLQLDKITSGAPPGPSGTPAGTEHCQFIKNVGWVIEDYQTKMGVVHEGTDADDALIPMDVPYADGTGLLQVPRQRTPSELLGLGTTTTRESGDLFWSKVAAAGAALDEIRLAPDETALPKPDTSGDAVTMDRVAASSDDHRPDEGIWFRFYTPGGPLAAYQRLIRIYFTGIPTWEAWENSGNRGTGRYALDLQGDGKGILWEYQANNVWQIRMSLEWARPDAISGAWHSVRITSDARYVGPDSDDFAGSRILFKFVSVQQTIFALSQGLRAMYEPNTTEYRIVQKETANPTLAPVRVDIRRDTFVDFQVAYAKHRPTATLRTITKAIPFEPYPPESGTRPIYVHLAGSFPDGTSVSIDLRCEDGGDASCATEGSPTSTTQHYSRAFVALPGKRKYYAVITLNASSDGKHSPTIASVAFVRQAIFKTLVSAEPVIPSKVAAVSVSGASEDPTHETAMFRIHDPKGDLARLDVRANVNVRARIYYDAANPELFTIGFIGRIAKARKRVKGVSAPASLYYAPLWGTYTCICLGEWARAAERQAGRRYNFNSADPTDGVAPYKASTALRALFEGMGLGPNQYHVPDSSIRLFTNGDANEKLTIEPYAPLLPIIVDMAREYFGAHVQFCANSTNGGGPTDENGCWRVIVPKRADEEGNLPVLCHFLFGPNTSGKGRVHPGAYSDVGGVKATFVKKFSLETSTEPPEGNVVRAVGVAPTTNTMGASGTLGVYERLLVNWPGVDAGQGTDGTPPAPDPTHPDWTDGSPVFIPYTNPALTTQKTTDWAARRIFDRSCHTRHWKSFEAPLVLVRDLSDDLQIRHRPLRFGDYVTFNGEVHVVYSVSFGYSEGRGRNQMAAYEIFTVPGLRPPYQLDEKIYAAVQGRMR